MEWCYGCFFVSGKGFHFGSSGMVLGVKSKEWWDASTVGGV